MIDADVIVIGAGIIGCAVARELSRYNISVVVVESCSDVAEGATKANSGIIHAGFDAIPGTNKAKYNVIGSNMYADLCLNLGVNYNKCGALVLAFDDNDEAVLESLYERGIRNGVLGLKIIGRDEVLSLEPNTNPQIVSALYAPSSAIVSPYEVAFALADDAAVNGVQFMFDELVSRVMKLKKGFHIVTSSNEYTCRVVINCAGSSGALIHNQLCEEKLTIKHRRGQYYLLDRTNQPPFSRTIFQCPSKLGKGVLVSPTIHGNTLIGPTAEDIPDPSETETTRSGLSEIVSIAKKSWPQLSVRTNITNFSGVRAHLDTDDFKIGEVKGVPGAYEAIGIESPGLSSAPAIAVDVRIMVTSYLKATNKETVVQYRRHNKSFRSMNDEEREKLIKENPKYGNIVCRCEMITEAEIIESINRPIPARTIDSVKRRTRAGMGRCQGGFCTPRVAKIIADNTKIELADVTKCGNSSNLLVGTIDQFLKDINANE